MPPRDHKCTTGKTLEHRGPTAGGDLLRTAGVTPKETHRTDAVSRTGSDSADAGALTACCAAQRNTQTFLQAGKATARILFLQA